MTDEIHNMTHEHVSKVAANMDAYLLAFFGSYENAKQYAHLYVIEEKPGEIETSSDTDLTFKVTMLTEYRIRLKTQEELAADIIASDFLA